MSLYVIKASNGATVARTGDRKYAEYYARHIGGAYEMVKNPYPLRRNSWEEASFGRQPGTESDRKNLFGQYKSTKSFVWARETIQNSVDNKATNVVFSVTQIQSGRYAGCVLARIVDNGTGMDMRTLQEKFLTIGGTGKGARGEETGTVGGFGEAKKVVLLAWQAWRVITKTEDADQAIIAEANEGWEKYRRDYITPPPSISRRGTIVEVISWPEPEYLISTADARNFISYCDLPAVRFTLADLLASSGSLLNGDFSYNSDKERAIHAASTSGDSKTIGAESFHYISGFRDKIANFELGNAKQEFSAPVADAKGIVTIRKCAKLYYRRFSKDQRARSTPRVFYRVKGLYLWSEWKNKEIRGDIIIDFTIKTTLILTDNRDSISNTELRESIDEWITDLIKDPGQKLRGFTKMRTFLFEGSAGSLQAPMKPAAIAAAQSLVALQEISGAEASRAKKDKEIDKIAQEAADNVLKIESAIQTPSPIASSPEMVKEIIRYEAKNNKDQATLQRAIERAMFVPEYILHIEDDLAEEGYKIPEKFKPDSLTKDIKKLLAVWAEMIRLVFMMKGTNLTYAVGFVFSEEIGGLHAPKAFFGKNEYTGRSALNADGAILLNPYFLDLSGRKQIADVSNPEHIEAIWAICLHECTHMVDYCGYHDEAFASCLTRNIGTCARVYPLVELISEIVQTTEPLARAKFAKGLDVEEYLSKERKRGRKPKTAREKQLEKYAAEIAGQLALTGRAPPRPEDFDVEIPAALWEEVISAAQAAARAKAASGGVGHAALQSEMMIKSLRNRLALAEEKLATLEKSETPALPPPRKIDPSKIFKKYNG